MEKQTVRRLAKFYAKAVKGGRALEKKGSMLSAAFAFGQAAAYRTAIRELRLVRV
jgi:hypothetical protein